MRRQSNTGKCFTVAMPARQQPQCVCCSPQTVTNSLVNNTYLLYQCGTLPPAGVNGAANAFEIPLTSVSVPDTVPYAFLVSPRVFHIMSLSNLRCFVTQT